MRFFFFYLSFTFYTISSFAQNQLTKQLALNYQVNPTTNLFVHFDKNIYSNNETIYFTAYLLKSVNFNAGSHKILAVALIKDIDTTVIKEDKFLIQDGISFGSMVLPDSILTGDYHLLAYTDKLVNHKPELIFSQAITIKTNIEPSFKANISLMEKEDINSPAHKVLISLTSADNRFLPKPAIITYNYGGITKTAKTDASSQLLLTIPKQKQLNQNLQVKLKYQKDSSYLNLVLPVAKDKAIVKFYPEGGNLVANLPSTIAWEVSDQQHKPIALTAFLFKNNSLIDTIETDTYGIGKFRILVEKDANYTVKLIHNLLADSTYHLPKAINNGLVINVANAIVQDTLKVLMKSNAGTKYNIQLHNFKELFLNIPFDMEYNTRSVKIPLAEVPKGLTTITFTDSLNRPLAERIFFAHYDDQEKIKIKTDQNIYKQREKVSLHLSSIDTSSAAMVSVAVVQENRMEIKKMNDIESYTYLKNELENLPIPSKGLAYKDKSYLEQILLVKGWRRYTWQNISKINESDTLLQKDSLQISAMVTKGRKGLSKAVDVGKFGDENISLSPTDSRGYINLYNPNFFSEYEKRVYLFVNDPNKTTFSIKIDDSFNKMSNVLAKGETLISTITPTNLINNASLVLKGNEKAIRLKEVVISNKNDQSFNYATGKNGANACGDYVCQYNILNCRNHTNGSPGNTEPVVGRVYVQNGISKPYQECKTYASTDESFVKFNGIRYQKEFYLSDYKDPLEPAFFSTIYWNYGTILNKNQAKELSFYTSDITGKFKVIVQGITTQDVVYAEHSFEVKPKQNP